MTIQNADDARALSERNRWDLETLLVAIEEAAMQGERSVFLQGHVSEELRNELTVRGFQVELKESDTKTEW